MYFVYYVYYVHLHLNEMTRRNARLLGTLRSTRAYACMRVFLPYTFKACVKREFFLRAFALGTLGPLVPSHMPVLFAYARAWVTWVAWVLPTHIFTFRLR
jgi:hypothetical protein